MEYNTLSNIVNSKYKEINFKNNFFEKDDLISDLYLFISEQKKEFTEKEILEILKKKYNNYFEIFDIEDKRSYNKYEKPLEYKEPYTNINNPTYEYFENIIWKKGIKCSNCNSNEVYILINQDKYYNCRSCGINFSFSRGTNLERKSEITLKNLMIVYNLLKSNIVCLKNIQEITKLSKNQIISSYRQSLPSIINNKPIIEKLKLISSKQKKVKNDLFFEYEHQTKAIDSAIEYYKFNNRGKIIHPCGSGKTYTSIQIIKKLNAERIIVIVPSRILLYQQLNVYKRFFKEYKIYAFGCLYNHIIKDSVTNTFNGSVKEQKNYIKAFKNKHIIFTTIKSFLEIESEYEENFFDIAIFDEAHRIAGEDHKKYLKVLDSKIYNKSLFLTATEKICSNNNIIDMEDFRFGKTISNISMRELIEKNIILDYKIINISFRDKEILNLLNNNKEFFINKKLKLSVKSRIFISVVSLIKCLNEYPIKKVITYHSTIEESILFTQIFKKYQKKYNLNYDCNNIHSDMSEVQFNLSLNNFENNEYSIISNVNCFQEGIDIKDVDAVLYGYPKNSKIAIVQSIGRCIRKEENKKFGYIIVPSENNDYDNLIKILNSLEEIDNRITEFKSGKNELIKNNLEFKNYLVSAELEFNHENFYNKLIINNENYVSYKDFKKWLKNNNIKSGSHYRNFEKPNNLPINPIIYKDWKGWKIELKKTNNVNKPDFKLLKDWIIKNNIQIKGEVEWRRWYKHDYPNFNKPLKNIPKNLNTYKKQFKGFKDLCNNN